MPKSALMIFAAMSAIGSFASAHADDSLVLVASGESPIVELNSLEIRKLYLGFVVRDRSERQIQVLTNSSDSRVMAVFLQNVMAMTQRAYDRRLLTLTVQSGRARPRSIASLDELRRLIVKNEMTVTCMWRTDANRFTDVKVIKILWAE